MGYGDVVFDNINILLEEFAGYCEDSKEFLNDKSIFDVVDNQLKLIYKLDGLPSPQCQVKRENLVRELMRDFVHKALLGESNNGYYWRDYDR